MKKEKRIYAVPALRVFSAAPVKVICSSSVSAMGNESYGEGETTGWY